jgi:hypothetical protein
MPWSSAASRMVLSLGTSNEVVLPSCVTVTWWGAQGEGFGKAHTGGAGGGGADAGECDGRLCHGRRLACLRRL